MVPLMRVIALMLASKKPTGNARSKVTKRMLQAIGFVPIAGRLSQALCMAGIAPMLASKKSTGNAKKRYEVLRLRRNEILTPTYRVPG